MGGQQHSLVMEMVAGDDGAAGPSRLEYYQHKTASPSPTRPAYSKRNTSHLYPHDARALARGKDAHAYS